MLAVISFALAKHSGIGRGNQKNLWKTFGSHSVYLDVDTSEAGFSSTPHYVVTMNGMHSHWSVVGGHAIYEPTATSFRIYLLYEVSRVTAKQAQQYDWRVNWIGSTGQSLRSLLCAVVRLTLLRDRRVICWNKLRQMA